MAGPAVGEPDPGIGAPSRTESTDAARGILILLALGLALRLIIAYLLPGSGFRVDIQSFQFWANDLADNGLYGFYDRPFFHDYTPGYLYVLWAIGSLANLFGTAGPGDLIKVPPILADIALGYLVWSMSRELGASERASRIAALLVVLNPVTWVDSTIWGQVDSVGLIPLLLAVRELWRDRLERAAVFAMLAALIKPQLGIIIFVVAIVAIRRALVPRGGYGDDDVDPASYPRTSLEARIRGPLRILTTGAAGFLTAIVVSLPFGLSLPGLIAQVFSTAAGYPYLSVNAYNPWALVSQARPDGSLVGVAVNRGWACDAPAVARDAFDIRIGDWVLWHVPATAPNAPCVGDPGVMFGALPAVAVGALLFLAATVLVLVVVWRRPDRRTIVVGLAVLALAFFVLPTRVHERYLFPLIPIAAILGGVSLRWRAAQVVASVAVLANMYAVLTTLYGDNPGIRDWLGIGGLLTSYWGVAAAAAASTAVFAWTLLQLRDEASERLADEIEASAADEVGEVLVGADQVAEPVGRPLRTPGAAPGMATAVEAEPEDGVTADLPVGAAPVPMPGGLGRAGSSDARTAPGVLTLAPAWVAGRDEAGRGPWAWFMARFGDRPIRADRTASLAGERGGRLDRLDVWVLAVLAISLLTVRMWRLPEPYQMHFDEVYHPRTATEFLQYWRYGISHDIYEWTHPHLAKYAMALGIVAFAEDRVVATSRLDAAVVDAAVEPRRDDDLVPSAVEGDRLWVATGSEIRAYDLRTRSLAARASVPGAVAVAFDRASQRLYVGTRGGEVLEVDPTPLDDVRGGAAIDVAPAALLGLGTPVERLFVTRESGAMAALLGSADLAVDSPREVAVIDLGSAAEVGRVSLPGVRQFTDGGQGRIAVAYADGLGFIDVETGTLADSISVGGPASGAVRTSGLSDDPIYVPYAGDDGPMVAEVVAKPDEDPRLSRKAFRLPGGRAGRAYFDEATRMVHVAGARPDDPSSATVYVIEPHGNAVYADAVLPFEPAAIVMDDNQRYPSSDRQQLLAFDEAGEVAAVPIGLHAYGWRLPGVIAGVLMTLCLYLLARLLFARRSIAIFAGLIALVDGMLFAQSRIGMNDAYVGLGVVAAYMLFAAIWRAPTGSRRSWLGFAVGMPAIGILLGLALAAKWVAAYAIAALGVLALSRSALGRVLAILGLVLATTVLGYLAISVPEGESGGNYGFLAIMVGLTLAAVVANVSHPIAWTLEERRFATFGPVVAGLAVLLASGVRADPGAPIEVGPLAVTPIEVAAAGFVLGAVIHLIFLVASRFGFGPLAPPPAADDPGAVLDPPAPAPRGWLRLGTGWGIPAAWLGLCLVVLPVVVYVLMYVPWAFVESNPGQIVTGWPPDHTGKTLIQLTGEMYDYHNRLSAAHPASSPWWAWPFDLKPVWFYQESFAGSTSAAIYDAGNLVAWWLAVPAIGFAAWQAYARRSPALALVAIGFAFQWIAWSRIDRAAFQYHYYTSLPFLFLALGYFLAELWHGPSRRTWLLARIAAAVAVLAPFGLWVLHRPLCAAVRVTDVNPGSQACPTLIPELPISPGAVGLAVVLGIGVLLLLRELLALADEAEFATGDGGRPLASPAVQARLRMTLIVGAGVAVAVAAATLLLRGGEPITLGNIPVEPIALVVTIALAPVAAYVATARDSRRFAVGAVLAMAFWFVLWYPNIAALPLPSNFHNAYQGFLPTYLYPFQFPVSTLDRTVEAPSLFAVGPAIMLVSIGFTAIVVGYSTWSWRVALAERRLERGRAGPTAALGAGSD